MHENTEKRSMSKNSKNISLISKFIDISLNCLKHLLFLADPNNALKNFLSLIDVLPRNAYAVQVKGQIHTYIKLFANG